MSALAIRSRDNNVVKIALAFAAIYTIWGTTYLGIRVAVETIPPFFMAGARFLIAGLLTFAFLRARGAPMPSRCHWRSAAIVGAFLLVGGNGFVTWSERQVPSGIAALVVATVPLWMVLFDWLIFGGSRPGKQIVTGLLLGFAGIGLLLGPGQLLGSGSVGLAAWIVLFMAPVLWSLGSLHSRRASLPENPFMSTALEMTAGGFLLVLAGLFTGEAGQLDVSQISARSVLSMLYLAFAGSIVALTAYVWLLKTVQAARVATYTYVNPVIALFLGWLVLSETITPITMAAVAVIVAAVVLITTAKARQQQEEEREPKWSPGAPCDAAAAGD